MLYIFYPVYDKRQGTHSTRFQYLQAATTLNFLEFDLQPWQHPSFKHSITKNVSPAFYVLRLLFKESFLLGEGWKTKYPSNRGAKTVVSSPSVSRPVLTFAWSIQALKETDITWGYVDIVGTDDAVEILLNIWPSHNWCDLKVKLPTYDTILKWNCSPSENKFFI